MPCSAIVNRSVGCTGANIGRDGFSRFARQAGNGFVARENCFFRAPSVSLAEGCGVAESAQLRTFT
jgi:hypothetical protein